MGVKGERVSVYFPIKDLEIYKYIKEMNNSSAYIVDLIRKDLEKRDSSMEELKKQVDLLSNMMLGASSGVQVQMNSVSDLPPPIYNPPATSSKPREAQRERKPIKSDPESHSEEIEDKGFEISQDNLVNMDEL